MAGRIAELSAGAGGPGASAALAKAGTVAVLAGGVVAGPALVEKRGWLETGTPRRRRRRRGAEARSARRRRGGGRPTVTPAPVAAHPLDARPSTPQREPEHRAPAATTAPADHGPRRR